jgi:hypothetical protein
VRGRTRPRSSRSCAHVWLAASEAAACCTWPRSNSAASAGSGSTAEVDTGWLPAEEPAAEVRRTDRTRRPAATQRPERRRSLRPVPDACPTRSVRGTRAVYVARAAQTRGCGFAGYRAEARAAAPWRAADGLAISRG